MNAPANLTIKPSSPQGIAVIDADTHVTEWDDLWTSRAPAKYKSRVPQKRMLDGKLCWVIDEKEFMYYGGSCAIRKDGFKCGDMDFLDWNIADVHPGSYDVKERVRFMDETGIWAQVAYPNVLGFGGKKAATVDAELRLVSTQIYNEAMAEMQADSGNRIFPMALLPWWDLQESVAEARRGHAMGLRGININPNPHVHGLPDLGDPHWDPLWEVCIEHDMPVNFHIGFSDDSVSWSFDGGWPSHSPAAGLAYGSTMLFMDNLRTLANIMMSRFLERLPTLKIVSVESGVGWLPFALEAIQYEMNECNIAYKVSPIDLFRRQIYACSWFERENFPEMARVLGVGNIMFETDFPHPTCLYPDALPQVEAMADRLGTAERTKIFGANAARVYNIPLPGTSAAAADS